VRKTVKAEKKKIFDKDEKGCMVLPMRRFLNSKRKKSKEISLFFAKPLALPKKWAMLCQVLQEMCFFDTRKEKVDILLSKEKKKEPLAPQKKGAILHHLFEKTCTAEKGCYIETSLKRKAFFRRSGKLT